MNPETLKALTTIFLLIAGVAQLVLLIARGRK